MCKRHFQPYKSHCSIMAHTTVLILYYNIILILYYIYTFFSASLMCHGEVQRLSTVSLAIRANPSRRLEIREKSRGLGQHLRRFAISFSQCLRYAQEYAKVLSAQFPSRVAWKSSYSEYNVDGPLTADLVILARGVNDLASKSSTEPNR